MHLLWSTARAIIVFLVLAALSPSAGRAQIASTFSAPSALVTGGTPVDWVFVFKQNAAQFPTAGDRPDRNCEFGGTAKAYSQFSQVFASASSQDPILKPGLGLVGTSDTDPLGATFAEIYRSPLFHVVWNDQFYQHPPIAGCSDSCGARWGHSKGVLAWDSLGEGVVLQVTTPSWPASGSAAHLRPGGGNTLGCVNDDNIKVSQDFFALRLTEGDVEKVLDALANASVVTNIADPSLVRTGGPAAITARAAALDVKSPSATASNLLLSTGVRLLPKPSAVHVPPHGSWCPPCSAASIFARRPGGRSRRCRRPNATPLSPAGLPICLSLAASRARPAVSGRARRSA